MLSKEKISVKAKKVVPTLTTNWHSDKNFTTFLITIRFAFWIFEKKVL